MRSPEAWLTIVVAGVLVTVVAFYIVRWLDRGTSVIVAWLAQRGQKRQAERMARIAAARSNRDLLNLFKMRTVGLRLRGVALLILALALAGMAAFVRLGGSVFPWAFEIGCFAAVLTALVALVLISRATSIEAEMREAEKPGS
jgi:hypothetical protein